jgi:alkylation response protein AidB-like acyl-CoA dehydrogenase
LTTPTPTATAAATAAAAPATASSTRTDWTSPDLDPAAGFLRQEVRAALASQDAATAWRTLAEQPGWNGENDPRPLYRVLGRRGLLAPNWPAAFGGRGLPAWSAAVVVEELIAAGVPEVLHTLSVQICGNFLMTAGTPEQRGGTLPALAAGTAYCTVLYTEPAAGSDLASLSTTAEPDGAGGWLLTGRKVYSVRTGLADFGLVAARIGEPGASRGGRSPYQAITLFLVPLTAPGITVDVLPSMADEAFADVRLDRVPVTAGHVIGPVGGGWPLITAALALERTGVDYVAKAEAWLRAGVRLIAESGQPGPPGPPGQPGQPVPPLPAELGRLWTRVRAGRALSARCVAELDTGQVDPVRAAVAKLWTSESAVEVARWTASTAHDAGLAAGERIEAAYREAPGLTISAGTSQMMCELIAAAGLPSTQDADPLGLGELPGADGLITDLRRAIRWAMPGNGAGQGGRPPVNPGEDAPGRTGPGTDWPLLASLGVFGLHVPAADGGYGLGLPATLAAAAELGGAGYDGGLLDTLAAADALAAAGLQAAGPESPGPQSPAPDPAQPPDPAQARQHLEPILAGQRAAALIWPDRPLRPLADPGDDGAMVIVRTLRPAGNDLRYSCYLLDADRAPGRPVSLAGEDRGYRTVSIGAAELSGATLACEGQAAQDVVTADLLRRAAWLLGAGWAALTATVSRTSGRNQFGRTLIGNQSVAFELARLTAHGRAIGALTSDLALAASAGKAQDLDLAAGLLAEAGRFASEATRAGVQLHGAFGMVRDSPVEPLYRRVRLMIAQCPPPWVLDAMVTDARPAAYRPANPGSG